ncbi:SAM-dependent methyltransferase [Actinoplanes aureus]|uniref:SAM-dependent methyltransferase n=1 Tax=Actinoplanes aureus TaxID=2792083 RepID=A0A931CH93_9ACTN|nr:SAM-dependent methyltransferase [Actinoplanes aureus]MBG0567547.1 SAM-dependent methyltransferase [Actinoplanes aureus]
MTDDPKPTVSRNNNILIARREAVQPSNRAERGWTRTELADAVNRALAELYPCENTAVEEVDGRWIGKLERGLHSWPSERRRAALRHVLGVRTDAELGLYIRRKKPRGAHQVSRGPSVIDTSTPHPARRYNYWLGGKDHFEADRRSADEISKGFPTAVGAARANRAFLRRAVTYLAKAGIRQFLDIGTGLPAPDNTHEVAQRITPEARVVYVDNDPIVMTHARALLLGDPRGRTAYLEADLRDPEVILQHPALKRTLDLTEPVALLLIAVLHFIQDDDQALAVVRRLRRALPPGSYLVVTNATIDFSTPEVVAFYEQMVASGKSDIRLRPIAQFSRFFEGLELVEPGIVPAHDWRAEDLDDPARPSASDVSLYGAIGRVL